MVLASRLCKCGEQLVIMLAKPPKVPRVRCPKCGFQHAAVDLYLRAIGAARLPGID